jgi:hypothetical protein
VFKEASAIDPRAAPDMNNAGSTPSGYVNAAVIVLGLILGAWAAKERGAEAPPRVAPDPAPAAGFSLWDLYAAPPISLSILYGEELIYDIKRPQPYSAAVPPFRLEASQGLQGD